jgi:hypothetical protein
VARFFAPFQIGPGVYPAFCTMGTSSLFRGVKRPGRGVDHPLPSSAEVKENVELYFYSLGAFTACSRVTFTFTNDNIQYTFFILLSFKISVNIELNIFK